MERATSQLVLLGLASGFGEVALAAYSIVRRLENFLNFGSMGVAQAAGVMVGQNLGAKKPVIPGLVRVFLIISPTLFVTIFTSDPDVMNTTSSWLRVQVLAAFFMGMATVFQQCYNTAGDTFIPMVVTLIGAWAVEIPLAFGWEG